MHVKARVPTKSDTDNYNDINNTYIRTVMKILVMMTSDTMVTIIVMTMIMTTATTIMTMMITTNDDLQNLAVDCAGRLTVSLASGSLVAVLLPHAVLMEVWTAVQAHSGTPAHAHKYKYILTLERGTDIHIDTRAC